MAPETISADAGRMLTTFLGLVSASVLPSVSLLVNSMSSGGRSVETIRQLKGELDTAIDALFLLFGCVAIVIGALVALSIDPSRLLERVPYLTTQILPRAGQALVIIPSVLVIMRAGQIPAIIRRSLSVRYEISLEEARKRLAKQAPPADEVRKSFATHPDFGKSINLSDITAGGPK